MRPERRFAARQAAAGFLADVLAGLEASPKTLPCKYLYDARGSELFERICELPEYYLTRTELAILRRHAGEIAALLGPRALVVEPGSGAGVKIRVLLAALAQPAAYVPIDVSPSALEAAAGAVAADFPDLEVLPVCADFALPFAPPRPRRRADRAVVFFPGSTIGNFEPDAAVGLLARFAALAGPGGAVLLGADLAKPAAVLEPAYDDAAGVTAKFNLNLLARINRELGADFALDRFAHRVRLDPAASRVEMHLESRCDQVVHVGGRAFAFAAGETIHTESSYKHTLPDLQLLAGRAGLALERVWTDERAWFAVQLLAVR